MFLAKTSGIRLLGTAKQLSKVYPVDGVIKVSHSVLGCNLDEGPQIDPT